MSDDQKAEKQKAPPEDLAVWRMDAEDRKRLKVAYANQLRASNWLLFKAIVGGTLLGSAYYGIIERGAGFPSSIIAISTAVVVMTMLISEIRAKKHVKPLGLAGEMAIMTDGIELRGPEGIVWQHRPTPNVRTYWKVLRIHHASTEFLFNEVWAGDGSAFETSRPILLPIPNGVELQAAIEVLNTYNEKAFARAKS